MWFIYKSNWIEFSGQSPDLNSAKQIFSYWRWNVNTERPTTSSWRCLQTQQCISEETSPLVMSTVWQPTPPTLEPFAVVDLSADIGNGHISSHQHWERLSPACCCSAKAIRVAAVWETPSVWFLALNNTTCSISSLMHSHHWSYCTQRAHFKFFL